MKKLALLFGLAVFLVPGRAELGRIHYDEVSLDDLLGMSPTIAVVRPAEPSTESRTIELGEGIEPFTYALMHYEVVEYLRPAREAKPGERLVVTGFDQANFDLHVMYYAHGVSKSPLWPRYEAKHPPADPSESMIVFLHRSLYLEFDPKSGELKGRTDTMATPVHGAYEGIAGKDKLARRAKKPCGCTDEVDVTIGAPGVDGDQALRDRIDEAVHAKFSSAGALSWRMADTRPRPGLR
jgi:hypothetical protein